MQDFNQPELDRFIILDGHAIIYRAYHAFKDLTDPEGKPINAVYGFSRILLKAIADFQPVYLAVAFDHKNGKSKRLADYKEYKAQRPQMPDDLKSQIDIIKDVVTAFNIPQFEVDGFEADDILGTISRIIAESNKKKNVDERVLTTLVTGDKDILQLVDDNTTHVFIPGRGQFSKDKEYDEKAVVERLGVTASQIPDLKALMGDPSDNIPGVKGIGEKTAVKLIQRFKSLEAVYDAVEKVPTSDDLLKGAVLQKLLSDKEMAFMSKKLATIQFDAPIDFDLKKCVTRDYDKEVVTQLFEKYRFNSLLSLLPKDGFEETVQNALF